MDFDIDDAIISSLYEEPRTYTNLRKRVNQKKPCVKQTFTVHLKKLVGGKFVMPPKNKNKLYSLNSDTRSLLQYYLEKISLTKDNVDQMISDTEKLCFRSHNVQKGLATFTKKDKHLFLKPSSHVENLLAGLRYITIVFATKSFPKSYDNSLLKLQTLHTKALEKLFQLIQKEKISLSIVLKPGTYIQI